jgi:hypothetical protein
MCVPVRRGVPEFLRCAHPSHGGVEKDSRGDLVCERCGYPWRIGAEKLTALVDDAMQRETAEWRRQGVVVLVCGEN